MNLKEEILLKLQGKIESGELSAESPCDCEWTEDAKDRAITFLSEVFGWKK